MSQCLESLETSRGNLPERCYVRRFEYLNDVTRYIREKPRHPSAGNSSDKLESTADYENWYQSRDLAEALNLYENGWSISDEIDAISSPIYTDLSLQIEREDINYEVNGHYIDVARFVDGEPECWGVFSPTIVETPGRSRVLKVVVCVTASAGVDSQVMKTKGILAATTIKLLEFAGYRCEVIAYDCRGSSRSENPTYETRKVFPIKKADQYLDESRMAFAIAHPSMLRRICFALDERYSPDDKVLDPFFRNCEGGCPSYGCVLPVPKHLQGDVYFDDSYLGFEWSNVEQAKAWVVNRLREQGVKFKS